MKKMRMHLKTLSVMLLVCAFVCSCGWPYSQDNNENSGSPLQETPFIESSLTATITPTPSPTLEPIMETAYDLTVSYTYEELNGYFYFKVYDEVWQRERRGHRPYDEAHEKFTGGLDCTYSNGSRDFFYTVYKVAEGGFYYAFWSDDLSPIACDYHEYLPYLRAEEEFSELRIGDSSDKVFAIDPWAFNLLGLSSGSRTISALSGGKALWIGYDVSSNDEGLIYHIKEIRLLSSRDMEAGFIAWIRECDLPPEKQHDK